MEVIKTLDRRGVLDEVLQIQNREDLLDDSGRAPVIKLVNLILFEAVQQAASDIKNSIDPEMRTIQAELESAEKEMQETIEAAKQPALPKEPPTTT